MTGVKASTIKMGDKTTMQIFSGLEPLGIEPEDINSTVGTYGILSSAPASCARFSRLPDPPRCRN